MFLLQYVVVQASYPWWGGVIAAFLVFSSVLCIPGVAILRKLGFLRFSGGGDYAKNIQAETAGHTTSTTAFLKTGEDDDSGHNSDELNAEDTPYVGKVRDTSCAIDERVTFGLETETDNAESKL